MSDLFYIIIGTVFINNIIVDEMLGSDPALAYMRRIDVARGLSITMLVLLPSVTFTCYLADIFILQQFAVEYFRLLVFVGLIFVIILILQRWLYLVNKTIAEHTRIFLPLVGINTTVVGTALLAQQMVKGPLDALFFGLGSALGFSLVLILMTGYQERMSSPDLPKPFRGLPITLITLGIISMSFKGFTGLI